LAVLCGVDIIEIERIKNAFEKQGQAFRNRAFTEKEIAYCESKKITKYRSYSARFAAKEALVKALGTGISKGILLKDIEVLNGKAKEHFIALKGKNISLSLSHCESYAVAYVIIETTEN
jgi:holo-[acyl-carrier protein] synthase